MIQVIFTNTFEFEEIRDTNSGLHKTLVGNDPMLLDGP